MKKLKLIKLSSSLLFIAIISMVVISGCKDDDGPVVIPTEFTALNTKITEAEALITSTEEGAAEGQYPRGSQDVLQTAIDVAKIVANDDTAEQTAVDNTVIALQAAMDVYTSSIIEAIDPTNLIGHWTFDEISDVTVGSVVKDYSGNSNDGAITTGHSNWGGGLPTMAVDRYGDADKALHFDEGGNVKIPYNIGLNPVNISLSLWAKADVNDPIVNNQYMIALNRWNGYKLNFQDSPLAFFTVKTDETIFDRDNASPLVTQGEWWHIVVTFGDGHMMFYLDGVLVQDWDNTPGTAITLASPIDLIFGQDLPTDVYTDTEDDFFVGWGGYYIGTLDEVRIYKSVLSATQVASIFELEKP